VGGGVYLDEGGKYLQPSHPFIGEREGEGWGGSPESATDVGIALELVTSGVLVSPAPGL
jgi:hypothetical protein